MFSALTKNMPRKTKNPIRRKLAPTTHQIGYTTGSLWGELSLELIAYIMNFLASMDCGTAIGKQFRKEKLSSARDTLNFASTCLLMWKCVYQDFLGETLASEMEARRLLDCVPINRNVSYPHLAQKTEVVNSKAYANALRNCESTCAFHCSTKHCRVARKEAMYGIGLVLTPVLEWSIYTVAVAKHAELLYVLGTSGTNVSLRHYNARGEQLCEIPVQLPVGTPNSFTMVSSPCGSRVAITTGRSYLLEDGAETETALFTWKPGVGEGSLSECVHPFPRCIADSAIIDPSGFAWVSAGEGIYNLTILWSIHRQHGNHEAHVITNLGQGFEYHGGRVYRGSATGLSSSEDGGVSVVTALPYRIYDMHALVYADGKREILPHNSSTLDVVNNTPLDWELTAKVSPTGDIIACVHTFVETYGNVVEVFGVVAGAKYQALHLIDRRTVLHQGVYVGRVDVCVSFTICGAFVIIAESAPGVHWDEESCRVVVVNLSQCRKKNRSLAYSELFPHVGSSPREIHCSVHGLWVLVQSGIIRMSIHPATPLN